MQCCDPRAVPVIGVDFTSAPRAAKPIVVAHGWLADGQPVVTRLERMPDFPRFEAMLARKGPWVGGFDLPFGLPAELVSAQGWPRVWQDCIAEYAAQSRDMLRERFRAFCAARPVGGKFAHRATDGPAGSSPSMKWVNPPVAWMLHAGVPRLIAAGLTLPGLFDGDPCRLALEAYPGLLIRSISRASYKSDTRVRQTEARRIERARIVSALLGGQWRDGRPVRITPSIQQALIDDASGDSLDAVVCLVQAAWGLAQPDQCFGLAPGFDPLEGWIIGARRVDASA